MMNQTMEQFGRVGVLMGGISSEREISLKSGKAITEALLRRGFDVVALDINDALRTVICSQVSGAKIDIAFIALHGQLGEDGAIQSILDEMGIPYVGSGVEASRLAINKALAQNIFKKNGINVPTYVTLSKGDELNSEDIIGQLGGLPVVVKPVSEGSSIGIQVVKTAEDLAEVIEETWQYGPTVLIEKHIQGRELTVGIINDEALPVVEICPKNPFFDYEAKYTKGMTDYVVPAEIPDDLTKDIQDTALKAHRTLGCEDFSRVDFMLDAGGMYYVLEVNTIPGFTSTSLLPKAAQERGISFDQLCFKLVECAYGKKKEIKGTTLRT